MPFQRIYLTGPVTELFCYKETIFAGIGSQLHVYCTCSKSIVQVLEVLPARVIHGIQLNEFSDGQTTTFCVYGQKSLQLVQFENSQKNVKTLGSPVDFDDWIWDVSFIKDDSVCLTLGHNVIVTYDLLQQTVVSSVHCQEKCILYCAKFLCTDVDCVILAAGTVFNQVVLWSTLSKTDETGRVIPFHRLTGHQGVIFSIDYDRKTDKICSVSDDRSIRLYQLEFTTGSHDVRGWENVKSTLLHVLYGHSARVWDVCLLHSTLISVGEDSTCCVWSYSGNIVQKFKGHKGKSIWSMCVDKGENLLVTGGGDNSVRLWNLNNSDNKTPMVTSLDLKLEKEDFPRNSQFIGMDIAVLITNEGKLLLYNVETSHCDTIMSDVLFSSYTVMDISCETKSIAIANVSGTMKILAMKGSFNSNGCEWVEKDVGVCVGKVLSILWLNSHTILTTSPNGIVDLWHITKDQITIDVKKGYTFELTTSRHRWVTAASLSPDGGHVVCGDRTGSLFVYELLKTDGKLIQAFPKIHGKGGVTYVCCHSDSVYSAGRDGTYRLFAWNEDKTLNQLQNKKVLKGLEWIEKLNFVNNDDIQVLGFHSDTFVVWSIEQNQKLVEIECGGGHRAWDFCCFNNVASFLYVKKREVKVAKVKMRSNQVIMKKCLHGRELCDGKFISAGTDSVGNKIVAMVTCSEDTSICLSFLCYDSIIPSLDVRDVLSGHISSVRCLYVCSSCLNSKTNNTSCPDRKLIFSGGGRAQLRVWRVSVKFSKHLGDSDCLSDSLKQTCLQLNDPTKTNVPKSEENISSVNEQQHLVKMQSSISDDCENFSVLGNNNPTNECDFSYECLGGLQLSQLTRKHWKPWRQPLNNSDPETRIVDLSVISPESRNEPLSTVFILSAACSDGIFRLLTFCESTKDIHLIASFSYHDHSILKTSHFILPAPKKCDNQSAEGGCHEKPEKEYQPIKILVLSAATDGRVAIWDISEICSSVTSNPDNSSLTSSEDVNTQKPEFTLDVHQSGVNSLYFGKYTDGSYILVTGGDDNALTVNVIYLDIVHEKVCMSVSARGGCVTAHSAQITGTWYLPQDKIVTASIDQRICLWCIQVDKDNIAVKLVDSVFTNVSDVSNIDVWTDNSGKQYILVSGNGLEVIELDSMKLGT